MPAALFTDEWIIENITYQYESTFISASIEFKREKAIIILNIVQRISDEYLFNSNIHHAHKGEQLEINGLNVFVFDLKREPYVKYLDGCTEYSISTNLKYDEILEIAKTIQ